MPRQSHPHRRSPHLATIPASVVTALARLARNVRRSLRQWRHRVPIEVLIADRPRRIVLKRELDLGLRRLQVVLGETFSPNLAVVAQQVIATDRQMAGCYQVGQRPDGSCVALIRLALQVNGRRLSTDELLAALADACIELANQSSGAGVVVPIELPAPEPSPASPLHTLRPDPLNAPSLKRAGANHHAA